MLIRNRRSANTRVSNSALSISLNSYVDFVIGGGGNCKSKRNGVFLTFVWVRLYQSNDHNNAFGICWVDATYRNGFIKENCGNTRK